MQIEGGSYAPCKSNDLETRRGFLLQLGLVRHEAYDLAKSTNFDVRRLQQIQQVYFARGYSPDEVMKRILFDVRDKNNWVENIMHEEQTASRNRSPEPINYGEQHFVKMDDDYEYKNRRNRSRSRSRSKPSKPFRTDQPTKFYRDDKYSSRDTSARDNTRRETFPEQHYNPKEEDNRQLDLRRSGRDISSMRVGLAEDHFRDSTGQINIHQKRSRSCSPEKLNNTEHFTSRTRSPNRILSVNYFPYRDDRSVSLRAFSPDRKVSKDCSRSHSPAACYQSQECVRSSRSRSPIRDMNEEYHRHHSAKNYRRGERCHTSREKTDEAKHFRAKKSRSDQSGFDIRRNYLHSSSEESIVELYSQHDGSDVELAAWESKRTSSSYMLDDCKQNCNTRSLGERSPEIFRAHRTKNHFDPISPPYPNAGNIPSLLTLNIFPQKEQQLSLQNQNISSERKSSRDYSPPREIITTRLKNNIPSLLSLKVCPEQTQRSRLADRRPEKLLQDGDLTNKMYKRPSSRDSSPPRKLSTPHHNNNIPSLLSLELYPEQNFQSDLRKERTDKHLQHDKPTNKKHKQISSRDYSPPPRKTPKTTHNNIPSLLSLKLHPEEKRQFELRLQNLNTSPPLSIELAPNTNYKQQQLISRAPVLYAQLSNEEIQSARTKNATTGQNKQSNLVANNETQLRINIANVPVIHSGLAKPLPGFLKANPRDYWSKWWPHFKYIEYSIPKINRNDSDIKSCLNYLLEPNTSQARNHKSTLIKKSITTIMKTKDINENNYYKQDIFKIFQYKKHLEDSHFQNSLTPDELNSIAPALRQFQIRTVMALLHQALIVKWHLSLEIRKKVQSGEPVKSNYATQLLNNKCFHYLVMESIQELKKMCQKDWPEFTEFYKTLKAKKVDIYSLGVGPQHHS